MALHYKYKKKAPVIGKQKLDSCLQCSTHFKRGLTKILWKDVAQCMECGHVWVLLSLKEFQRWR